MVQFENAVERFGKLILTELIEQKVKCWIAGGALRDYFSGVFVNTDYDIFFPDEVNYKKAVKYFKDNDAEIRWESDNGMKVVFERKTFDLVKKFFPDPEATIQEFDFTVSMIAVDGEKVYHGPTTFVDLSKKQLMINKITYPASTLKRAFKYYQKGFSMCTGEMKKMVIAIQEMEKQPEKPKEEEPEQDTSSGDDFFNGID